MIKREVVKVYYDGSIAAANRAIEKALADAGPDADRVCVIAFPISKEEQEVKPND